MAYTSTSTFPTTIDSFPSLEDNRTNTLVKNSQVFFAQHFNILADAIYKCEAVYYTFNNLAISSKVINLSNLNGFCSGWCFYFNLATFLGIFAPSYYNNSSTWCGNIFPFEVFITTNSSRVNNWPTSPILGAIPNASLKAFKLLTTATDIQKFNDLYNSSLFVSSGTSIGYEHNCYTCKIGGDTILIRGFFSMYSPTNPVSLTNTRDLSLSIFGVQ